MCIHFFACSQTGNGWGMVSGSADNGLSRLCKNRFLTVTTSRRGFEI